MKFSSYRQASLARWGAIGGAARLGGLATWAAVPLAGSIDDGGQPGKIDAYVDMNRNAGE
jgi:hypothetical protein